MNVATIYSTARLLAGTDSVGLTDATAQTLLNIAYRDCLNAVKTQVNEDFFYDEWTADLVSGQREYSLPARTGLVAGCNKLLGVSVKSANIDNAHKKCYATTLGNLPKDLLSYSSEQPANDPIYVISDNSVFIYPSPSENITGGLKLYGVADPVELATGGAENTVKLPLEHHETLVHGLVYWFFTSQQRTERATEAKARYDEAKRSMVSSLSDRTVSPITSTLPNLSNLE